MFGRGRKKALFDVYKKSQLLLLLYQEEEDGDDEQLKQYMHLSSLMGGVWWEKFKFYLYIKYMQCKEIAVLLFSKKNFTLPHS